MPDDGSSLDPRACLPAAIDAVASADDLDSSLEALLAVADLALHPAMAAIFISDQIGISKPNVKLYQRACMDLNILPTESMYIGDNPTHELGLLATDAEGFANLRTLSSLAYLDGFSYRPRVDLDAPARVGAAAAQLHHAGIHLAEHVK